MDGCATGAEGPRSSGGCSTMAAHMRTAVTLSCVCVTLKPDTHAPPCTVPIPNPDTTQHRRNANCRYICSAAMLLLNMNSPYFARYGACLFRPDNKGIFPLQQDQVRVHRRKTQQPDASSRWTVAGASATGRPQPKQVIDLHSLQAWKHVHAVS